MTDCNDPIGPMRERMPVLLHEDDYERWVHGAFEDIVDFRDRCPERKRLSEALAL
jgi:putative SOS response-associated peptidase YedK